MKFLIITHVQHKTNNGKIYGYGPYIKEMNLWLKYVDEVQVVGPMIDKIVDPIDLAYEHENLSFVSTADFNITSVKEMFKTFLKLPLLWFQIIKAMVWAEHIHLRCPGNMGLLGSFAQIFFPHKMKTAKYAGNWDPDSRQPWSYNVQKWILSNTFLTKNMKVLVYGEWPGQSKNVVPFFTASYSFTEVSSLKFLVSSEEPKTKNLLYVGALSSNKRPLLSIQTTHKLIKEGIDVHLDLFGEGAEREVLEAYIEEHKLEKYVVLHGNQNADVVKEYFQKAHFLIFISKSEGWPKVVAEAMFWGCLPITTNVSCVNYMIGNGERGKITEPNVEDIVKKVKYYLENPAEFEQSSKHAMEWSQQFTLEKFEEEIGKLLNENK